MNVWACSWYDAAHLALHDVGGLRAVLERFAAIISASVDKSAPHAEDVWLSQATVITIGTN